MEKNKDILKMISNIFHEYKSHLNQELKDLKLTSSEAVVIHIVGKYNDVSQEEIGKKMKADKAFITRILKNLTLRDYIKKEKSKYDFRENRISLTKKSKNIIEDIDAILEKGSNKIFENISDEEIKSLEKIFGKMKKNLEDVNIR